jgi:hypothetical protein
MESCGYSEDTMIAIRDGEHQLLTDMNMELDSRNNVPQSILHREDSVGCSCQTVVYSPQSGFESRKRERGIIAWAKTNEGKRRALMDLWSDAVAVKPSDLKTKYGGRSRRSRQEPSKES